MTRNERLLRRILSGRADANIRFTDLRALMQYLGFDERIRGSHHVYRKEGIVEKTNLQRHGGDAKPYKVRQVRRVFLQHNIKGDF